MGSTAPTVPAGFSGGSGTPSGFGPGLGTSGLGLPSSPTGGIRAADFSSGPGAQEAALFGDGVAIRLPDGSSAMAPNGV
ncbi:glycoside hydrolase, partial [Mycolicibacterium mageritense]|nr:glycoside hydrolase [Mycolicibacterium mageritense]